MDALQHQHMSAALHEHEMAHHAQLVQALERMGDGSYGRGERCGQQIPYGRFLVTPEARTCTGCGGG